MTSPGETHCTPLMGLVHQSFDKVLPDANEMQLATLELLGIGATFLTQIFDYESMTHSAVGSPINGLLENQWMLDLAKVEHTTYAMYQNYVATHPYGFTPGVENTTVPPQTRAERQLCRSQKIVKQAGFANIHVFGLSFTLAVSGVLVILDFSILRGLMWLSKIKKSLSPGIDYWIEDGLFQLQRAAYQGIGQGTWGRLEKEIPWTIYKDHLCSLGAYTSTTTNAKSSSSAQTNGSILSSTNSTVAP